jgi:CubicO group peptidase (beta-lactamase class C family)
LQRFSNLAIPHRLIDGEVLPLPLFNMDNAAPAGGINSNAIEMAQWIRLQLGEGVYQGQKLLSAQRVKEMQTPNIALDIPKGGLDKFHVPADHFLAYGLGWFVMDYRGRKIVLRKACSHPRINSRSTTGNGWPLTPISWLATILFQVWWKSGRRWLRSIPRVRRNFAK